jgi:hypothetical protein
MQTVPNLSPLITPDNILTVKFAQIVPPGSAGLVTPLVYVYYTPAGGTGTGYKQIAYNEWPAYYQYLVLAAAARSQYVQARKDDDNNVILWLSDTPAISPITDPVIIDSAYDLYAFGDTAYTVDPFIVAAVTIQTVQRSDNYFPSIGIASGNVGGFVITMLDASNAIVGTPTNCTAVQKTIIVPANVVRIIIAKKVISMGTDGDPVFVGDNEADEKYTKVSGALAENGFVKKDIAGKVDVYVTDATELPLDASFYKNGILLNTVALATQQTNNVTPSNAEWDALVFGAAIPPAEAVQYDIIDDDLSTSIIDLDAVNQVTTSTIANGSFSLSGAGGETVRVRQSAPGTGFVNNVVIRNLTDAVDIYSSGLTSAAIDTNFVTVAAKNYKVTITVEVE